MATESKDVELRVRAKDYSRKTLQEIVTALDDLTKAQEQQLAGAKKGEVSAKALADSYKKMEQAVEALIGQHALTKTFESQAAALQATKEKADLARQAQTDYANSLIGVEDKTNKQIAAQERLARAVEKADSAQLNAQTRLDRTNAKLAEYGIATDNIAVAQKRMADGVAIGNAALDKQAIALDTLENDIKQNAAATVAAAAAERSANEQRAASLKAVSDAAAVAAATQARNQAAADAFTKKRQEQILAERAVASAMRQSADQAEASAKGYSTLARSITSVRGDELANQLREIATPAATANDNLNGLQNNLNRLGKTVSSINGPVKEFRATMAGLEAAQKGAAGIAAQIDAYRRQIDVLRAARTEYSQAQAAVRDLTAQMRAGGGDAAALTAQLNAAQSALKNAASSIQQQVSVTRDMRAALNAAAVDTRKLSDAEQQLVSNANAAKNSMDRLSEAYKKHGAAAKDSTNSTFKFFDSTRTTLGFAQRLRGELLGLAVAYVGVQGAINTATAAIDAFKTAQKVEGQLGAAFGNDAATIRKEWDYLMATSNRIGINFKEAAPAYAKFAIAANSFGLSGNEIKFIFEKVAGAARVAGLSADEFQGVLKAVEQGFSKGTIQAEELRGQLGDRLPGAFTVMAKSLGLTTAELTKMMEQGQVTADSFVNFARQLPESFKPTETALTGLLAQQERYNNALFEFQLAVANSGFADAYTKLLIDLAALMNSADGKKFAEGLSIAFTAVVDVIRFLIKHVDEVKIAFSILMGLAVAKWAYAAFVGLTQLWGIMVEIVTVVRGVITALRSSAALMTATGTAAKNSTSGLRAMGVAISGLLKPLSLVMVAIETAIAAYKKLGGAKAQADNKGVTGTWEDVPGATPDPGTGGTAGKRAAELAAKEAEKRDAKLKKDRKSALKKDAKDELDERAALINEEFKLLKDNATRQITDKEALSKTLITLDRQEKFALETDRIKFQAEHAKSNATAANKEITLKDQVKNALAKIQDDITNAEVKADKNSTFDERKKARLDAISHAYDKLRKSIKQLEGMDKAGAADANKKLDAYIAQLQAVEGLKVTTEEVKRLETELDDQTKLRNAALEKEKLLYDAGLSTQEKFLANSAEINRNGDTAITKAANDLQSFVDAAVKAKAGIVSLTDQAEIKTKTTSAIAGASNTGNKIADQSTKLQEEAIDNLIAKRNAADQIYKAQFDLRMISEDQYAQKVNANAEQYKAQILALNTALLQQLETQRAQGILEGTLNPARLAALDAQIAKQQLLGTTIGNAAMQADTFSRTMTQTLNSGLDSALNGLADGLTNIATGASQAGDAFSNMARSALSAFAQILQQIAMAIAKQLILNAIASSGGIFGQIGAAAGGVISGVNHSGGVIGRAGGTRRNVSPGWFSNAPKFHNGGLPGLRSDEVPSILQTGEEVLARDDPRNVLNGDKAAAPSANPAGTRFVLLDDRKAVPEAMQSAEGEDVVLQIIRRNGATVKSIVKG